MNQLAMIQQIMKAPNKETIFENLIKQNPQISGVWEIVKQKDYNSLEGYVKDIWTKNGRNFDKEFSEFKSMFK